MTDILKTFLKARTNLRQEKTQLESRLREINSVLGGAAAPKAAEPIVESGKPRTESNTGHVNGSFPSREAAELAAVQTAKALIDLR